MKNVIITGASRGIGIEMVNKFIANDFNVIVLTRNLKPLQEINQANLTLISTDLEQEESMNKAFEQIKNKYKTIDILVHNAGMLVNKPFEELTSNDFFRVFQVNVFAVAHITKLSLPMMPKGSHVVSISSMGGIQGSMKFAGLAAYSSSKGALITLSELLAQEYMDREISFNVLALGAVQTQMLKEAFPDFQAKTSPEEMAEYIYDFAINGNKFLNGKTIQVSNTTP